MEYAILVMPKNDKFVVLTEGEFGELEMLKERTALTEAKVIKVDKSVYEDKKKYLDTLNDYIAELCKP